MKKTVDVKMKKNTHEAVSAMKKKLKVATLSDAIDDALDKAVKYDKLMKAAKHG